MTIINDTTVVIYDSAELKKTLEENNNYTYIYFGSDIVLTTGINISSSKTSVTLDGTYNGVKYLLEDKKSTSASDVITASSASIKKVTVKNMSITGYNYYGVIYVPENNNYKDIVVEYNYVDYVGPQISYHPTGLTRFMDCNIIIQDNYASGNEVSECNKIEIGGNTIITHKSTGNSSFWFRNDNPSLTILKDSLVYFTSEKRELFYGTNNLTFTISKNAEFSVITNSGMGYGTFGTGTTTIEENAKFYLKQQSRNGSYPTWYSYGKLTLNNNSTLSIISNYSNITSSNYNLYFSGANARFILNNPLKVVLYNTVANVIYTSASIPFEFNFTRLNLFNNSITINEEITKANLPTYAWYKNSGITTIKGTFTNSATNISSNNYTEEELANLPSLSNFIFSNKKIMSVGDFQIHVNTLTDTDTELVGLMDNDASILIEYNDVSSVIKASSTGNFSYSYDEALPIGTVITLTAKSQNDLIYHTKVIQIIYTGELILDEASKLINFVFSPISIDPVLCPRKNDLVVVVTDSRANSTSWKLYAALDHDLISSDGKILKDAIVFIDEDGNITNLSTTPILVYTGEGNGGSTKVTNVSFSKNRGILLRISDSIASGVEYESLISWSLEE